MAESKEYGRQYIELTRKYSTLFKQGWRPPWPKGSYSNAKSVAISLDFTNNETGLCQILNDDGLTAPASFGGRRAHLIHSSAGKGHYIYFAVHDSFKANNESEFRMNVEYFDAAPGRLMVEFDGSDENAPLNGAYTRAPEVIKLAGSQQWHNQQFTIKGARFTNAQNRGADLRLVVEAPEFAVARVNLSRVGAQDK